MTSLRILLAQNIKEKRGILGISQAKLAERVKTSTHYIGQIEIGNKYPTPEMLERIAAALEMDSPQLFSMATFSKEIIWEYKKEVMSDLESMVAKVFTKRLNDLEKSGKI
jgi:transcriptional regulator with XRE-family HTH domain